MTTTTKWFRVTVSSGWFFETQADSATAALEAKREYIRKNGAYERPQYAQAFELASRFGKEVNDGESARIDF